MPRSSAVSIEASSSIGHHSYSYSATPLRTMLRSAKESITLVKICISTADTDLMYIHEVPEFRKRVLGNRASPLLPIPHSSYLGPPNLPLQLENSVEQCFASRRASWYVDINGNDAINPPDHTVAIVVVTPSVCTAAHADDPSWLRHLIVALPHS